MMRALLCLVVTMSPCAFAVNGADDSVVIPPGPLTARPMMQVPLPSVVPVQRPQQRVNQLPIDTPPPPVQPSPETSPSSSSSGSNPMSSFMPMLQGMGGGDGRSGEDRAAGSGDSGTYAPAASGPSSALDIKGGAGQKNGVAMTTVDGCASGDGKFQLIYGHAPGRCNAGRDGALKMSETLSSFLDRNLNRCASEAAGKPVSGGQLFHAGVIGDARHQQTGSLHNLGLAIDVNAIVAGGQRYTYAAKVDPSKSFFDKFRTCWGKAAQTERLGCLQNGAKGLPPGTVGDEDSDHTNHLHLSVPLCPAEARAKGIYLAWLSLLPAARAAEASEVSVKRVMLPAGGRAEVLIRDQHGEPVDADHRFAVRLRCDARAVRTLAQDLAGCEFVSFAWERGALELRFLTSEMKDGELACRKLEIKRWTEVCPPSKKSTPSKG